MNIPQRLFAEPITVEPYLGNGAYSDQYGDPVTVLGHLAAGNNTTGGRVVQSGGVADEVVSSQRLLLPNPVRLADGSGFLNPAELLQPESRVTTGSVTATVSAVAEHRKPGSGALVYVSAVIR